MILLSVFCVVLSLDFGVSTPQGNRFKESSPQNEGNNDFNVERNIGDPMNPYNQHHNQNELISQENQKSVLMQNEDYEQFNTNNNAPAFRNINQQSNVIPENKSYNQFTDERNFNTLNDEAPRPSYIGSLPKVKKIQTFRPKNGINHEANIPRMGDIISEVSEVNNPKNNLSPIESNPPITQERNPANKVINRQNSQVPENFQTNSHNVNEATFQNPSAEILYETGQAKPYEISNEPLSQSRKGNTHAQNILHDKQRLKNLYLSSKPTKHYMIVYPDGRVEQVDQLDKIQKKHPNYVMLNAKELLQHGKPNKQISLSQGSVMKQNLQITTTTTMKPFLNSIKDSKGDQIDKVPQKINEQTLPDPVAPEPSVISTSEVTETNNMSKSNKDEENTNLTIENKIQKQFQESEINENQEENRLIKKENSNPEKIVTTSDVSSVPVSTISTTETPVIEDTVTTVRSTISTPTENVEFLNQNISNSPAMSNNTDSSNLLKEIEERNRITSRSNLINAKHDDIADENTTPTPKQESNEEDERTKNTTTILVTSDLNSIQENSYRPDNIETSNVNNERNSSNSSPSLESSSNREESNSAMKSNNVTVITSEDGIDSDGNTFHTEKIISDYNNESNSGNLGSNNVISSEDSTTLVTTSNKTDHANYSIEDIQNNTNPLNGSSSDSLTNNTLDIPEKDENNTDTITIQIVSDIVNSEIDDTKKDGTSLNSDKSDINSDAAYKNASSYNTSGETYEVSNTQEESTTNKTLSSTVKQDGIRDTDGGTDDSDALPTGTPDMSNKDDYTATNVSNGGANSSNEEDTTGTALNDSYYLNSPKKGLIEDEEDDDNNETKSDTIDTNDNLETESDGNGVIEPSIWFNASDSFWNKLMNSNEHNSFYFLFPRPKPNTKDTKKIIYPNGTIVIETTETVDNDDGETTSSKTIFKCGNCTTCEKIL